MACFITDNGVLQLIRRTNRKMCVFVRKRHTHLQLFHTDVPNEYGSASLHASHWNQLNPLTHESPQLFGVYLSTDSIPVSQGDGNLFASVDLCVLQACTPNRYALFFCLHRMKVNFLFWELLHSSNSTKPSLECINTAEGMMMNVNGVRADLYLPHQRLKVCSGEEHLSQITSNKVNTFTSLWEKKKIFLNPPTGVKQAVWNWTETEHECLLTVGISFCHASEKPQRKSVETPVVVSVPQHHSEMNHTWVNFTATFNCLKHSSRIGLTLFEEKGSGTGKHVIN